MGAPLPGIMGHFIFSVKGAGKGPPVWILSFKVMSSAIFTTPKLIKCVLLSSCPLAFRRGGSGERLRIWPHPQPLPLKEKGRKDGMENLIPSLPTILKN
jgi:hypothetical protein